MNNTLAITSSISRPLAVGWKFSLRIFWILSFILVTFLLIFYIFQINEMTKASFLLSNYERRINILSQEQKALEINFLQANSLENVESLIRSLNFEPVGQVYFIKMLGGAVVAK